MVNNPERKLICEPQPKQLQESDEKDATTDLLYEVGLEPKYSISDGTKGDRYKHTAIMSLDGLLSPVSISGRNNKLSRYSVAWKDKPGNWNLSKSRPSMPPIMLNNSPSNPTSPSSTFFGINQVYLNPILTKNIIFNWDERKGTTDKGCNIQYLGFNESIDFIVNREEREKSNDLSFQALRGPLVLQAWGYDTMNKPIPNAVDDPTMASLGKFNNNQTKNKFMKNWLQNPMTWPVGPIDLRFDRDRGVWVSPPQDRIVVARLIEDLPGLGKAFAVLINPQNSNSSFYGDYTFYGPKGEKLSEDVTAAKIVVYDFLDEPLYIDTTVYAYYDDNKYIILDHDNHKPKSKYFKIKYPLKPCGNTVGDEYRLTTIDCPRFKQPCKGLVDQTLYDIHNVVAIHNLVTKQPLDKTAPTGLYVEAIREKYYPQEDNTRGQLYWKILRFVDCVCESSSSSSSSSSGSSSSSSQSSEEPEKLQVLTNVRLESDGLYFDTATVLVTDVPPPGVIKINTTTCPENNTNY